jgi:hypothetical protein
MFPISCLCHIPETTFSSSSFLLDYTVLDVGVMSAPTTGKRGVAVLLLLESSVTVNTHWQSVFPNYLAPVLTKLKETHSVSSSCSALDVSPPYTRKND